MSDVQDYTSINNDADIARDDFSLKARLSLAALFLAAILMVALVAGVSFRAFRQIEVATGTRKHISTLITQADALISELTEAETGQRGYLLTGDKAFLDSYWVASDNIKGNLEELRQLNFNPAAQKHLDGLPPLVNAKLAELAQTIELRRNHNMDTVLEIVAGGKGERLMDSIRTGMSGFIHVLENSQGQNNVELQSNMRNMFAIIVSASLFTLLFAILFALLIYRKAGQRLKDLVHFETLPAAVYPTDAEGLLTYFNPFTIELTGRVPNLGVDHWCVSWKIFSPSGNSLSFDQSPMAITLKEGKAIRDDVFAECRH
ncbi:MAG: CHASE3 domain-containing protein [Methylococcales bacterium]|nr:CHASE3 domain-containing protein [Methylococcales bacterium]MDD5631546.1 CHASE3 domain-containing protein [Methylococcales bacterium]